MRRSILAALIASLFTGCVAVPEPEVHLPATYTDKGVSVTVNGLLRDNEGTVIGIDGVATNVSGEDLKLCEVTFDALDAAGLKVSSAIAATTSLKSGQGWRFQATSTNSFAVRFVTIAAGPITTIPASGTLIGHKFDVAKIDELVPGRSTIADATQLFGPPRSQTVIGANVLVQWQYSQGSQSAHVAVLFDRVGAMLRIQTRTLIGF